MKKITAAVLICIFALSMAACGESSSSGGSGSAGAQAPAATEAPAAAQTYDVGEFTVDVPGNYFISVQTDMFGEKDADGNYPVRQDAIALIKDGERDMDAFSKPTLYIYYYDDQSAENEKEWTEWIYDDCEDISVTVNGTECLAFQGNLGGDDGKDPYVYQFVFIPTGENSCFQINIPVDMVDFKGVTVEDADVAAIMASLKAK